MVLSFCAVPSFALGRFGGARLSVPPWASAYGLLLVLGLAL